MSPYRVLVTGSRDWPDPQAVYRALKTESEVAWNTGHRQLVVVHGAARGADRFAGEWTHFPHVRADMQIWEEAHPARWRDGNGVLNKRAGIERNLEMVNLGANVCLAFIYNGSRGASHCAAAAAAAGILVLHHLA